MIAGVLSSINFFAAAPKPGAACNLSNSSQNPFFGFPHWWEYLKGQIDPIGQCAPKVKFPDDLWLIGLAVIDILLTLAGIIAVVMIIIAGINYITTMGNPEKGSSARKRITNSLIGLGIVLIASAVVTFIGRSLGGT